MDCGLILKDSRGSFARMTGADRFLVQLTSALSDRSHQKGISRLRGLGRGKGWRSSLELRSTAAFRRRRPNSAFLGSNRSELGSKRLYAAWVIHLSTQYGGSGHGSGSPRRGAARGRRRTALTQFRPRFSSGSAAGASTW